MLVLILPMLLLLLRLHKKLLLLSLLLLKVKKLIVGLESLVFLEEDSLKVYLEVSSALTARSL